MVTVKVFLEKGTSYARRKFTVEDSSTFTFEQLMANILELYSNLEGKKFCLNWRDVDDDLIPISNEDEFHEAILCNETKNFRIYISVQSDTVDPAMQHEHVAVEEATETQPKSLDAPEEPSAKKLPYKWQDLMDLRPTEGSTSTLPYWAPFMARGLRRCCFRVWLLANQSTDTAESVLKTKDIPEDIRVWMRQTVCSHLSKAILQFEKKEDKSGAAEVEAPDNTEASEIKSLEPLPGFWRTSYRHFLHQAWKHITGLKDTDVRAAEKNALPKKLRTFMRKTMIQTWRRANGLDTIETTAKETAVTQKDEQQKIDNGGECKEEMPNKQKGVPLLWRLSKKLCIKRAWRILTERKLSDKDEEGREEGESKTNNISQSLRMFTRKQLQHAWKKYRADYGLDEAEIMAEEMSESTEVDNVALEDIPLKWRRAMIRSLRKLWLETRGKSKGASQSVDDTQGHAGENPTTGNVLPKYWKSFMFSNMRMAWRDARIKILRPDTPIPTEWNRQRNEQVRILLENLSSTANVV